MERETNQDTRRDRLRQLARQSFEGTPIDVDSLRREDVAALVHEFGIYQSELLSHNEELKRSQRELEEARQAYANLFEFAPVGYLKVSDRGLIEAVNLTACTLLGRDRERLLQRPLRHLFAAGKKKDCSAYLNRLFKEDRETTLDTAFCRGDGSELPVRLQSKLRSEGGRRTCRLALIDVSKEKESEHEREQLFRELSTVLETLPGFVNVIDREYTLLHANVQMDSLLDIRGRDRCLIGRKCYEVLHGRSQPCTWCRVPEVFDSGRMVAGTLSQEQLAATKAAGSDRFYKYFFNPIKDVHGRVSGVVKYIADVTDLEKAKRQAEEANRVKGDFLAKMSHEIRTPMNSVLGMLRLALDEELPPRQRDRLSVARESAESLLQLLNDLLDMSRIEAGKLTLQHREFSLQSLLGSVVQEFEPAAREKGLSLGLEQAEDLPDRLLGDPYRLRRILVNLLSNAIKYTDQGWVCLEAWTDGRMNRMAPGAKQEVEIIFKVRDTGQGIDFDVAGRIFEAYEQITGAGQESQGAGLGLAICKGLMEEMDGSIWVESRPGSGSTFALAIPFEAGNAERRTEPAGQPEGEAGLPPLRILLVEDQRMNQLFVQDLLSSRGHVVDISENGRQALDKLRSKSYDLVLMDLRMPVMDGLEATRRIRAASPWEMNPEVPVVGLSAHAVSRQEEREFFRSGFNAYLSKPLNFEALFRTLKEVLFGRTPGRSDESAKDLRLTGRTGGF